MAITYSEYLKIQPLLALQAPLSDGPEHDEMLFIIIHQVYELWFKQILHEVDYLQGCLEQHQTPEALGTLKRILTILKTLVGQLDILETMTPLGFASFRSRLQTSSGFQSAQFREFEFALGFIRPSYLVHFPEDSPERMRLEARMKRPSLYDSFLAWIKDAGYPVPEALLRLDPPAPREPSEALQEIFLQIYRKDPNIRQVCELLVDLDEGVQEWRYRHVKMVERTIGTKMGTGGSAGAEYLRQTLFRPAFADLWAIRASL